ncbi:MAG: hypothetical protein KDA59_23210, partial [Planctomycetales bacterium]|nr:hypothetical protein [Planctomycetales bacterium]
MTVGAVTGDGTVGVTNTGGDVTLSVGGSLTLDASITAVGVTVTLTAATDGIVDNLVGVDVTASSLAISSATGIGHADPLETSVGSLAAENGVSGDVRIVNDSSLLTITTVGTLSGVDNDNASDAGSIDISNSSAITIARPIVADQAVLLSAADSTALGTDNVNVAAGQSVTSNFSGVTLRAGDDVSIADTGILQAGALTASAATNIVILVDGAAGTDADNPETTTNGGSTVTLAGSVIVGDVTINQLTITGGDDNDTFQITPSPTAPMVVDGGSPTFATPMGAVPPGDTLDLNLTGLNPPTLTLGAAAGDGRYEFNGPPLNPRPIQYASIENVVANGPYHLVLDMDTSGFGNAAADDILMRLDPTSTNLQLLVNAAPFFEGEIARILSLQLLGSADDETFTVDDVNGLPLMQTSHPSIIADDNPLVAGVPRVLFAGNGGVDQLRYQLTQGSTSQTYGLGDGAGDGFGADAGGADGEVATIGTGTQVLYFTDLERPV